MAYTYNLSDLARWPTSNNWRQQINTGLQRQGRPMLAPDQGPPEASIQGMPSNVTWADVAPLGAQVRQRYGISDEMSNQMQFRPGAGVTPQDVYTSLQALLNRPQMTDSGTPPHLIGPHQDDGFGKLRVHSPKRVGELIPPPRGRLKEA